MTELNRRSVLASIAGTATVAGTASVAGRAGVGTAEGSPEGIPAGQPGENNRTLQTGSRTGGETPPTLVGTVTVAPQRVDSHLLVGTTRGLYGFDGPTPEWFVPTHPIQQIVGLDSDAVVLVTREQSFPNIRCIELGDGSERWATAYSRSVYSHELGTVERQLPVTDVHVDGDSSRVLVATGYAVVAIDGETGETHWRRDFDFYVWNLAVMDGTVYASTQRGSIQALDVTDGTAVFRKRLVEPFDHGPAGVSRSVWSVEADEESGQIVVTTEDGYVKGVDPADGSVRWDEQVLDLDDADLEMYYRRQDRPTSLLPDDSDDNFFNVDVVGTGVGDDDAILVDAFEYNPRGDDRHRLVLVDSTGEIHWENEETDLVSAGSIAYDSAIDPDTIYVPGPAGRGDQEVARIDIDSGATGEPIQLSIPDDDTNRRQRGAGFIGADDDDFVVTSTNGDLVKLAGESLAWRVPAIGRSQLLRGDFSGDGTDAQDLLVRSIEFPDREPVPQSRVLICRSGADGTVRWHRRSGNGNSDSGGGGDGERTTPLRAVRPLPTDTDTDVVALRGVEQQDISEDEVRSLEQEHQNLVDRREDLHRTLEDLHQDREENEAEIEAVEDELDDVEADIAEIESELADLDATGAGEVVVLSGRTGQETDTLELHFEDGPQSGGIEANTLAAIGNTPGQQIVVADHSRIDIVDLDAGLPTWSLSLLEDEEWPLDPGSFLELFAVETPADGPDDVVAVDIHAGALVHLETSQTAGEVTATVTNQFDLGGDNVIEGSIEVVPDPTGTGYDHLLMGTRGEEGRSQLLVSPIDGEIIRLEGEGGIRPGITPVGSEVDVDATAIGVSTREHTMEVSVFGGESRIFSHDMEITGQIIGQQERPIQPAAFAGNVADAGQEALAIAKSAPQGGAVVEFFDTQSGEQLEALQLERFEDTADMDRLEPALLVTRLPGLTEGGQPILGIVFGAGGPDGLPEIYLVDAVERRILASGAVDAAAIIALEEGIGILGDDGSIDVIDPGEGVSLSEPSEAAEQELSWSFDGNADTEYVTTVTVNHQPVAITDGTSATVRLPDGTHRLGIRSRRPDGFSIQDSIEVTVSTSPLAQLLVTALAGLSIVALFGAALVDAIKGSRRTE